MPKRDRTFMVVPEIDAILVEALRCVPPQNQLHNASQQRIVGTNFQFNFKIELSVCG